MIERFLKKKKIETNYETTLDVLYNLKQLKKSLRDYIEKARKMQRLLSKKIQSQISYKLVSELSDNITKKIVKNIIVQKESNAYDFEAIVKLVKSIAKNQDKKNSITKQQREMNSRNRMFASILNQNNKVIFALTRQFVEFNVLTSTRKRQFEDQRNADNVSTFYRNDSFNQKKQKYSQENQNNQNQEYQNQEYQNQKFQNQEYQKQQNRNLKKNSQHSLFYASSSSTTSFDNISFSTCYNCEEEKHFFRQCSQSQAFKKIRNKLFRKKKVKKRATIQSAQLFERTRTTEIFMMKHDR